MFSPPQPLRLYQRLVLLYPTSRTSEPLIVLADPACFAFITYLLLPRIYLLYRAQNQSRIELSNAYVFSTNKNLLLHAVAADVCFMKWLRLLEFPF
jgi:hypothetical protein